MIEAFLIKYYQKSFLRFKGYRLEKPNTSNGSKSNYSETDRRSKKANIGNKSKHNFYTLLIKLLANY